MPPLPQRKHPYQLGTTLAHGLDALRRIERQWARQRRALVCDRRNVRNDNRSDPFLAQMALASSLRCNSTHNLTFHPLTRHPLVPRLLPIKSRMHEAEPRRQCVPRQEPWNEKLLFQPLFFQPLFFQPLPGIVQRGFDVTMVIVKILSCFRGVVKMK